MSAEDYDMIVKIVIIGDAYVGKSNLLSKYLKNEFKMDSKSTVGVEFGSKSFNIDGSLVKVQIWDTAGQDRFKAITKAYYKGAKGAVVVYDITKKHTFESLDKWIVDLKENSTPNINMMLIGNKNDLEDQREISKEDALQKAIEYSNS